MKKFKLFALTALFCAMGTNAFAQSDLADGYLRYQTNTAGTEATITGFVATSKVAAVTIPATVTDPDPALNGKTYKVTKIGKEAFKGETIITSVTIADENVATIMSGAFENCTNLASVTIGKKVSKIDNVATPAVYNPVAAGTALAVGTDYYPSATGGTVVPGDGTTVAAANQYWTLGSAAVIGSGAFKGCTKLATVNFVARGSSDPALAMETGTFANTAIVKLDLTGTKLTVLNQLFEELNNKLTEVVLPATLTTIGENAFKQLATLATIDWSGVAVANNVTINANAFNDAPLITSLVLPGTKAMTLADNSLAGSNIAELTITTPATGNGFTVNATGAGAKLTTLTLAPNASGKVKGTIKTGAFTGATKLATININGDMESADQIASGSFTGAGAQATADDAGIKLTVNYTPKANGTAEGVASINHAAFAASKAGVQDVKLVTSTVYGKWIIGNTTAYPLTVTTPANTEYIYRVIISFAEATANLKVAQNGGTYYYAKLLAGKAYKIAKKQEQDVIVYGAYVDASDATIYMENLQIINGFYWVPANTPVIVKTKQSADVILTETNETTSSIKNNASGTASSEIYVPAASTTGLSVIDNKALTDKVPYFVAPIADYGFKWSKFKNERVLKGSETVNLFNPQTGVTEADFLIDCPDLPAGARLNVVWLDGSENEATAIQFVKNANVESDVIYNLAGQKVDANYKGIIIKNGKKMIQK